MTVLDVTETTFGDTVLARSHELPVVVDFWAGWCEPCKALAPLLERAVEERGGQLELVKVDVDANPGLSQAYGIRGIPAVKAFRDGKVAAEFVGAQSQQAVETFLDSLLGPSAGERLLEELAATSEFPEILGPLAEGDHERVLEWLLGRVDGADTAGRDRIREVMVAVFEELGHDHPLSASYRRRLASALY